MSKWRASHMYTHTPNTHNRLHGYYIILNKVLSVMSIKNKRNKSFHFTFYCPFSDVLPCVFVCVYLSFWHILFSYSLKNIFQHFFQGRSTDHKFLQFFFVCEIYISSSIIKDNVLGYRILGWCLFFFLNILNISLYSFVCMVSEVKSM